MTRRMFRLAQISLFLAFLAAVLLILSGCSAIEKMPPGSQVHSSSFGLKISPSDPTGTPFVLGSHNFMLNVPNEDIPSLNRFEGSAPFSRWKATTASGSVGDELQKAGGPDALRQLVSPIEEPETPALQTPVPSDE